MLTLKMKKSSMNIAPKGRIPAIRILQSKKGQCQEQQDQLPAHKPSGTLLAAARPKAQLRPTAGHQHCLGAASASEGSRG